MSVPTPTPPHADPERQARLHEVLTRSLAGIDARLDERIDRARAAGVTARANAVRHAMARAAQWQQTWRAIDVVNRGGEVVLHGSAHDIDSARLAAQVILTELGRDLDVIEDDETAAVIEARREAAKARRRALVLRAEFTGRAPR